MKINITGRLVFICVITLIFSAWLSVGCSGLTQTESGEEIGEETEGPETPATPVGKNLTAWLTDVDGNPIDNETISGDSVLYLNVSEALDDLGVAKSTYLKVIEGLPDELPDDMITSSCTDELGTHIDTWAGTRMEDSDIYELSISDGSLGGISMTPACDYEIEIDMTNLSVEEATIDEVAAVPFFSKCRTGYLNSINAANRCWTWDIGGEGVSYETFQDNFNYIGFTNGGDFVMGRAAAAIAAIGEGLDTAFMSQKYAAGASPCITTAVSTTAFSEEAAEGFDLWLFDNANYKDATYYVKGRIQSLAINVCTSQYGATAGDGGGVIELLNISVYKGGDGGDRGGGAVTGALAIQPAGTCETTVSAKKLTMAFDAANEVVQTKVENEIFKWGIGADQPTVAIDAFKKTKTMSIVFSYVSNVPGGGGPMGGMGGFKTARTLIEGGGDEGGATAFTVTFPGGKLGDNCGSAAIDVNGITMD